MTQAVQTKDAPKPLGLYPHARRAGDLLFLSGLGPRNPETNQVPDTFEGQCHQVFKNVRTVLEEAGANWGDLVDVTVFLTDLEHDFDTYNRLYADYFSGNQPCRTTLGVKELPVMTSPISIELKCIAHVGTKENDA